MKRALLYLLMTAGLSCETHTEPRQETPRPLSAPSMPASTSAPAPSQPTSAPAPSQPTSATRPASTTQSASANLIKITKESLIVLHDGKFTTLPFVDASFDPLTLAALLTEMKRTHPEDDTIEIKVDGDITHSVVVALMDQVRAAGFTKLSLMP